MFHTFVRMWRSTKYILFVILSCVYSSIYAQKIKFERYTTKDGLLSDEVYNLHQDRKGYIWIFTHYGAMKYNGKEFAPVLKNLPFTESIVYAFYENAAGRKWMANSNKNIYEIVNDSAFIVEGTQEESEKLRKKSIEIYQIYADDSINLYIKTKETVKFCKNKNYRPIELSREFKDSTLEHILYFKDCCIGIFNWSAHPVTYNLRLWYLKFIDPVTSKTLLIAKEKGRGFIKYYKQFGKDIYCCQYNNIIKISPDHSTKDILLNDLPLNFTKDKRGHLWVACHRSGLIEIDEHDSIINHYFPGKTVNDVLIDSDNGLWLSTEGLGLYHCRNLNELYYDESQPLGKPVSFMKLIDDKVIVGTTDYKLSVIDNGTDFEIDKNNNYLDDDPTDIIKFNSSFIVNYRLHKEELKGGVRSKAYSMESTNPGFAPGKIFQFGKDSLLFMGRNDIGILNKADVMLHNGVKMQKMQLTYKAFYYEKRKNNLLIATDQGVFYFKNDSLVRPAYLEATKNSIVTKICKDSSNNYWFCTKGSGLFKLNEKDQLINYTINNGLPGNIVNDIYFGKNNSCLLSNNKGLYYNEKFIGASLNQWYKAFDGEVQTALVFKGNIYVGTKNGLVILKEKALTDPVNLYFNLNSVYVNSQQVNENKLNKLNYRENNIEFKFDIISYSGKAFRLKYKLLGPSIDTGVIVSDKLNFKKLPPGCYTLSVIPCIKDENYHCDFIKTFTIIPAFWQTTWFFTLSCTLIIVFMTFGTWLLLKYYKNKELKKTEAERIIAEYRLIALKAQINPHFMSNCIAAIQHLILKNKVDEANEYLAKFSFLVRQVLNFSSKSFVTLKEELEIMDLYIKLEKLRFNKINFELNIDPSVNIETTFIPPLLMQPIIENAIWHGLLPLGNLKTATLSIIIKPENELLKIIIEDNGVGRQLPTNNISNSKDSKGIAITKQRIENLKYISGKDNSSLIYEDLFDEHNDPYGTRVIIFLPFNLYSNDK